MKKYFAATCLTIALLFVGMGIALAYSIGPNKLFLIEPSTGTSFKGLWVEATMKNNATPSWNYEKRVFAQSGKSGSWSNWVSKDIYSVTHRDYGSFTDDTAYTTGEWREPILN